MGLLVSEKAKSLPANIPGFGCERTSFLNFNQVMEREAKGRESDCVIGVNLEKDLCQHAHNDTVQD